MALEERRRQISRARIRARHQRQLLRRYLRESIVPLIIAAIIVGAAGGAIASVTLWTASQLHAFLFGLPEAIRLSAASSLSWEHLVIVLAVGGALVGLSTVLWRKRLGAIVDPIEANALHGGKMSIADSTFVLGQSIISSGCGASLGLEGGYTQIAGAVGSTIGRLMHRRRHEVRMLVGAGAASAIAGAFGAPFAGIAYGFELIIGSYTAATLGPLAVASIAGVLVSRALALQSYHIEVGPLDLGGGRQFVFIVAIGIVSGLLAVGVMRGATATEHFARNWGLRAEARPVAGGVLLAGLGWLTPHALGSGHGGIELVFQPGFQLSVLALVLGAKVLASSISIGTGFRGGLFSTSLFLGALTGASVMQLAHAAGLAAPDEASLFTLVGMASFGAAVIGAPITMALLVIGMGNHVAAAVPVLIGVVAATLTVRAAFGYSFATWRFHLRGELILGGADVGWIRDTTAQKLMRRDLKTVPADSRLADVCALHPLGSVKYVAATDDRGSFIGLVDVASLHASRDPDGRLSDYITHRNVAVRAETAIDRLLSDFESRESELLVVTDSEHRVRGYLTESYVLRRYREELDRRQKEIFGNDA